jgi:hypothetical protein
MYRLCQLKATNRVLRITHPSLLFDSQGENHRFIIIKVTGRGYHEGISR